MYVLEHNGFLYIYIQSINTFFDVQVTVHRDNFL